MKCHSVQKKFSAYQDKELKPQEQEEISRHLLSCQFCREQYAEFERVWQTLGELEEIRPDPWFFRQVLGKIKEPRKHGLLPGLQRVYWMLRAPAIASIILIVGLLAGSYLGGILARYNFFPFQNNTLGNSESLFTSLKVFDPAPPGTLAEGYLRMVSYKENESE